MEACDDIAYSVIDAEDTVKKGYASFYDLMDFLESTSDDSAAVREAICASRKKNDEFKKKGLSSRELNDISMQMFRVKAISLMIVAATDVFVSNVDNMLAGETDPEFQLIKHSSCAALCDALKRFDRQHGFHHSEVLRLELKGNNYIKGIMDLLWNSIGRSDKDRNAYERYAYGKLSENYRRVYEGAEKTDYGSKRLLCDAVSGMTEPYLIKTYHELKDLHDGPT